MNLEQMKKELAKLEVEAGKFNRTATPYLALFQSMAMCIPALFRLPYIVYLCRLLYRQYLATSVYPKYRLSILKTSPHFY